MWVGLCVRVHTHPCAHIHTYMICISFWSRTLNAVSNFSHFMGLTGPQDTCLALPFPSHRLLMFLTVRKSEMCLRQGPLGGRCYHQPTFCWATLFPLLNTHMHCRKLVLCAPEHQNDSDVCLAPVANLTGSIWWADPYLLITPLSKERGHLVTYVRGCPLCLMKENVYGCKLRWHPRNGFLGFYAMKSTFSFPETKPQIKNFLHKACQNGVLDTCLQWSVMCPLWRIV